MEPVPFLIVRSGSDRSDEVDPAGGNELQHFEFDVTAPTTEFGVDGVVSKAS